MTSVKTWWVLALLLLIPFLTRAQDCDCKVWPFKPDPPCFDPCAVKLLVKADPKRLQEVLNLPDAFLSRILRLRSQAYIPESLSSAFDPEEKQYIERRLRSLSANEAQSLLNSMK